MYDFFYYSSKTEIDWLEEEAQRLTNESVSKQAIALSQAIKFKHFSFKQEYMNYMSKKTNLRQTTIITLSDQNKKELDDIKIKKENMLVDFETRKTSWLLLDLIKKSIRH
jgi:hypothetical protein